MYVAEWLSNQMKSPNLIYCIMMNVPDRNNYIYTETTCELCI